MMENYKEEIRLFKKMKEVYENSQEGRCVDEGE